MKRGTHIKHVLEFWVLFGINGVMLWFFRGYFYLVIAVAMLLLFLYAMISVHVVKKHVTISVQMPGTTLPKGTKFFVKITIRNQCFLPLVKGKLSLRVGNDFIGEPQELDLILPVNGKGEDSTLLPLSSSYVGKVVVCAERFELEDMLGLHSVVLPLSLEEHIYILPEGMMEEELDLNAYQAGMAEAEESKLKGNDFSDVSEVREYIPGDAMKNIHWKLSAKKDVLMVKERLRMSTGKLLMVVALDVEKPEQLDQTVERVYGLGCQLIRRQVPVTIFWWSGRNNEICQASAESEYEWQEAIIQLFSHGAGNGYVLQHFQRLQPGSGCLLINNEGIFVVEG
nr:DUF58 domain-containing protein [Eubacterium sp.]